MAPSLVLYFVQKSTLFQIHLLCKHIYEFQFWLNFTAVADSIGIPMTDDMAVRELAEQATFRVRTLLQTGLVNNAITHPCT